MIITVLHNYHYRVTTDQQQEILLTAYKQLHNVYFTRFVDLVLALNNFLSMSWV